MSSKNVPRIETLLRFIKKVPSIDEEGQSHQILHMGFYKMTTESMTYNEVMEHAPEGAEGFVPVALCYN